MRWSRAVGAVAGVCLLAVVASSGCAEGAKVDDDLRDGGSNPDGASNPDAPCTAMCNGMCADLKTDNANCGKCGIACPTGATCVQGGCQCGSTQMKCGNTCVDLQKDNTNCGKCGVLCGNDAGPIPGGGTWDCLNGTCGIQCPMGKTECSGACVDTKIDMDNCGSCGSACMPMTETCTEGICCKTGQTACAGADGGAPVCTDVAFDANNCGKCGTVCPMNKPYCSNSTCTTCDNTVLILSDQNAAGSNAFLTAVNNAGLAGTLVLNGVTTYSNNPVAGNYAVVMVMVGDAYTTDMPAAGQQAIVNAQAAGKGVVITDWGGYHVSNNRWATLRQVNLMTYTTGYQGTFSFNLEQVNHPLWTGLPSTFLITSSMGCSGGTITNSGVRIAGNQNGGSCNGQPAVVVRSSPGGRIVYVAHAANYGANGTWPSDANTVKLTINAIRWATGCLL